MSSWGRGRLAGVVLVAGSLLAGCGGQATDEMMRQVDTLATAISWPTQYSAEGFARAALATPLGQGSSFSVVEVTELDAAELADQTAYLVIRLHEDEYDGQWGAHRDAVTACFGMKFNYYGSMGTPEEVDCPEGVDPITYPPAPEWADAPAFESALTSVLTHLPAQPSEERMRNALYGAWLLEPATLIDDTTSRLDPTDPRPTIRVQGGDVAVAITVGPECLLASRVGGTVTTRRPQPPAVNCVPSFN